MNIDLPSSPNKKEETLPYIEKITPMKAYMQEEIKALRNIYDQKLTLLMAHQSTAEELTLKLEASEKARKDLQSSIEETIKTYEENDKDIKNSEEDVLKQNKDINTNYTIALGKINELETSIISLNNKIADLQRAIKIKGSETIAKYSTH